MSCRTAGAGISWPSLRVPFGIFQEFEFIDLVSTNAVGAISFGKTPERATTPRDKTVSLSDLAVIAKEWIVKFESSKTAVKYPGIE